MYRNTTAALHNVCWRLYNDWTTARSDVSGTCGQHKASRRAC